MAGPTRVALAQTAIGKASFDRPREVREGASRGLNPGVLVLDAPAPQQSDPAPTGALRTARRTPSSTGVLLVAAFGAFLAFLDSTIVNVAFPDIQASFPESSIGSLSWVLNAYNIVFAAFLVAAGRFADLLGRRRVFVWGVVIFTLASVLCAAAGTVGQLIAFRVLQGIGAAMLVPASLALVVEGFDPKRRAHAVGLWGAAAAIASGLGPPIGGGLVEVSSWRLAFLVNLPLGVLAVVAARRGLVESRSPGVRRLPDLLGAGLLAVSLGLLTLGLVQGPEWGWLDLATVGALVGAVLAFAGFVQSSRRHPSPIIDAVLLRLPTFALGNAATVVAGAGFYAYLLTHVLWLSYVWDYSLLRAGLAVAPAALVAAVTAGVLGRVADARGHRIVVVPGALLWAASLGWYITQVGTRPAFLSEWLPGQLLQGLGVGATLPVLGAAALVGLPKGAGYATASAVVSSARQLGAVLGIAVLVVLIGAPTALTAVDRLQRGWILAAACFLAVAVACWFFGDTRRFEVEEELEEAPALPPSGRERSETNTEVLGAPELEDPAGETSDAVEDVVAELPLFRNIAPEVLARLLEVTDEVEVRAGEDLFREGDATDAMYIVRTGRLQVLGGVGDELEPLVLAEIGRSGVLGELGLLTGAPRSATVRAVRDATLLRLTREQLDEVADTSVMTALATALAARLQEVRPMAAAVPPVPASVVAVVGVDRGAPTEAVASALVEELGRFLRVAAPGRVDRSGLERAEADAARVVLVAGADDGEWRDFVVRSADRVVCVFGGSLVGAGFPARAVGCDLVLTGSVRREERARLEADLRPRSTHALPGAGGSVPVHLLRPLAARIAGRSIGLVLAGGGARAFAHLGVLEELERAGVPVDRYAGCSVGACIAAGSAAGWDASTVDAQIYEGFVRVNPIGDITVPRHGLVRGRRTVGSLERAFGGLLVEELPHELRTVSVDLLTRARHVHRSGRVVDAVASSLRLPGPVPAVSPPRQPPRRRRGPRQPSGRDPGGAGGAGHRRLDQLRRVTPTLDDLGRCAASGPHPGPRRHLDAHDDARKWQRRRACTRAGRRGDPARGRGCRAAGVPPDRPHARVRSGRGAGGAAGDQRPAVKARWPDDGVTRERTRAVLKPQTPERIQVLCRLAGICIIAGGAAAVVAAPLGWREAAHPALLLAVGVVVMLYGAWLLLLAVRRSTFMFRQFESLVGASMLGPPFAITLAQIGIGPVGSTAIFYVVVPIFAYVLMSPVRSWGLVLLVLSLYGTTLAVQDGYPAPVANWFTVAAAVASTAYVFGGMLRSAVEEVERSTQLRRFLAPPVAEALLSGNGEEVLTPHRRQIAVFFADLRGFTAFAARAEPEEVLAVLNEYYVAVGEVLHTHGATIGDYIGDGIMAYLNDPLPVADPAGTAVRMAIEARDAVLALAARWGRTGYDLSFGMGVAYGHATLGVIGFSERHSYAPLGTVVNLAARLCGVATDGEILIDQRTMAELDEGLQASADEVALKGLGDHVTVFRLPPPTVTGLPV